MVPPPQPSTASQAPQGNPKMQTWVWGERETVGLGKANGSNKWPDA